MIHADTSILGPRFTYRDVRYSVDDSMFARALKLFTGKKIADFGHDMAGYSARVIGTQSYQVHVSQRAVDYGMCNCYMGQNNTLCKHMIAVGLEVLYRARKIDAAGNPYENPPSNLDERKALLTAGLRKITACNGRPSSTWFAYQTKLDVGAAMIHESMCGIEPSVENAKFLWDIVRRVDRKLAGGVDDSNGTVWPVASEAVRLLAAWGKDSTELYALVVQFTKTRTAFEFNNELDRELREYDL